MLGLKISSRGSHKDRRSDPMNGAGAKNADLTSEARANRDTRATNVFYASTRQV